MHLNKAQDIIIEEFEALFDNLKNKRQYFRYLADLGAQLPTDTSIRTDEKLIHLSKSRIWLDAECRDGKVYYSGDSDNSIMRGILFLFLKVFSGRTPQEIIDSDIYFTNEIDLCEDLSPARRKEVSSILVRIGSMAAGLQGNMMMSV